MTHSLFNRYYYLLFSLFLTSNTDLSFPRGFWPLSQTAQKWLWPNSAHNPPGTNPYGEMILFRPRCSHFQSALPFRTLEMKFGIKQPKGAESNCLNKIIFRQLTRLRLVIPLFLLLLLLILRPSRRCRRQIFSRRPAAHGDFDFFQKRFLAAARILPFQNAVHLSCNAGRD